MEFAIFSVMLILAIILVFQLAWLGVQKWQFNHFALYSARVWSVQKDDDDPEWSLLKVQAVSLWRWKLLSRDFVKAMWVQFPEDSLDYEEPETTANGITYWGIAPLMPIYRNQLGFETLITIPPIAKSVIPFELPSTGLVGFATFIPIEKEPEEKPGEFDNDCEETPCESGNKQ